MTDMTIDRTVSRGNIWSIASTVLSAAAMIASVSFVYAQVSAKTAENEKAIAALKEGTRRDAVSMTARIENVSNAVQALQINSARTSAQYDALSRSMDELKGELREIGKLLRKERSGGSQ